MAITTPITESTTPLGTSDTFNGISRATNGAEYFRAGAYSDQTGTLNIQQSADGTNWYTSYTATIVALQMTIIESTIVNPHVRCQVVNGGTPQTVLLVTTCFRTS